MLSGTRAEDPVCLIHTPWMKKWQQYLDGGIYLHRKYFREKELSLENSYF
jgi:hypothetical protein